MDRDGGGWDGTWDDWSASGGKLQRERGLGAMHSDGVRAATAEESLKGAEERLTLSPAPDKYSNSCPGPAQAAPDVCSTPGLEESA